MVRSRKYALITAALALILIAAVVLTVVLVGDGSFYAEKTPQGSVSSAAVSVGSSTGEVSSDYVYQTLVSRSNMAGQTFDPDSRLDYRGSDGRPGSDGIPDTYVVTLNSNTRLLTQNGWDDVEAELLNVPNKSWGGSGYYEVYYNGSWYRFQKNSADTGSLFMSYNAFMTDTAYYQNSSEYALIIEPDDGVITYDPNSVATRLHFDATLDGAGATLRATKVLNKSRGAKQDGTGSGNITDADLTWFTNHSFNYNIGKDSNDHEFHGLSIQGLVFGSLRKGTFKNFKWDDQGAEGTTHYSSYNNVGSATTFGGLVGYAGPSSSGGSDRSSIYNVSLTYNKAVQHVYDISAYDDWDESRTGTFSGGLIGVNFNADIELVTVRMNGIAFEQQSALALMGSWWEDPDNAMSCLGGIVGLQYYTGTMKKVIISGSEKAGLYGHHKETPHLGGVGGDDWNTTRAWIGMIAGYVPSGKSITFDGIILDMNYNECYAWLDKEKQLVRGMVLGEAQDGLSKVTFRDIYLTDMVFAGSYKEGTPKPTPADVGIPGGEKDFTPTGTRFGEYTAQYWFYGFDVANMQDFAYLDNNIVSAVSFSDDTDYMLEISAPDANRGVMWNVKWQEHGSPYGVKVNDDTFMQNAREDVKITGYGTYDGVRNQNFYLKMVVEYASSYNFELANGHNDTGSNNKIYNGERVNYATLDLTAQSSDTVVAANYQPIYVQIGLDGKVTFYNNSGTLTSMTNFRTSGNEKNSNFANLVSRLFQLEFATNVDEGLFNVAENWDAQVDVNTYRWSSLGLFAVETGNGKFVFAPDTGTQAEVQITQRPISLNLLNPNAPYIGEAYSLAYNPKGGDYSDVIDGKVHYNFTSSVDDGKGGLIGTDVVSFIPSGGSFTARDAGSYVLNGTLSGADSGNYQYSVGSSSFTIEPAQAVITINGGSMVYGTRPTQAELAGMVNYSVSFKNTGTYLSSGFAAADGITPSFNMQTSLDTATSAGWMFARTGASVFNNNFPADEYDVAVDALTGTGVKNYVVSDVVVGTKFSVTQRPLTSTLPAVNGFIYGDAVAPTVGEPAFAGWASGDSLNSSEIKYYLSETDAEYTYDVRFGAGTYYVRAVPTAVNAPGSANGMNNYKVSYNDPLFEVEKRDTYVTILL